MGVVDVRLPHRFLVGLANPTTESRVRSHDVLVVVVVAAAAEVGLADNDNRDDEGDDIDVIVGVVSLVTSPRRRVVVPPRGLLICVLALSSMTKTSMVVLALALASSVLSFC